MNICNRTCTLVSFQIFFENSLRSLVYIPLQESEQVDFTHIKQNTSVIFSTNDTYFPCFIVLNSSRYELSKSTNRRLIH